MNNSVMGRLACAPAVAICLLLLTACGDGCDDPVPANGPEPGLSHELSGKPCGDSVTADIKPGSPASEAAGIERYDLTIKGAEMKVDLLDEGAASLGRLMVGLEVDFGVDTGVLEEWRVQTTLEGGNSLASQTLRGRVLTGRRLWLEIVHRAGSSEIIQWVVIGKNGEAERLSIAVALEAGADPSGAGRGRLPDGRVVEVLEILGGGGDRLDPAAIKAWTQGRVGDAFETNEAWKRLVATSNDAALWSAADAHVRLCQAASVDAAEAELFVARQALCAAAAAAAADSDGELDQRRQALCNNPFDTVLTIESGLGAVSAGAAITAALVTTGAIATGPVIGAVFVGSTVAAILVSGGIENFLNNNSDSVFAIAGVAGEVITGTPGDGQAFAEFFAGSNGDPHLDTLDGNSYPFHGAGEFVLLEASAGAPLEVQVRQQPTPGICPDVTVNTAVAARVGASLVAFYGHDERVLHVNGEPAFVPGGVLSLPGGGSIENSAADPASFLVHWPGGERMRVRVLGTKEHPVLDVRIGLPGHRQGQVRGLLGNFNDDADDEIRLADGTVLQEPIVWTELRDVFGHSWRVNAQSSLFGYEDGQDPSSFVIEGFPERPALLENLPVETREAAELTCQQSGVRNDIAFKGCVLDVACMGDASLAQSHTDRAPASELGLVMPIFLDGWTQQGDAANGNWDVEEGGRSVLQYEGGDPTFFVSPGDHHNATLRGTMWMTPLDGNFIGFVFGYRSPLSEQGDGEDVFDTFLLSWKALDETNEDGLARAGFVLSHLKGEVAPSEIPRVFWRKQATPVHRVIATNYGTELGWSGYKDTHFELTYTDEAIVLIVDGEEVFHVTAAQSPVAFAPGRFGFFTYAQSGVRFENFLSGPAARDPLASLQGLEVDVERPGQDFDELEMPLGDPRLCREACVADARCQSFTYRRPTFDWPTFDTTPAYCWLKEGVPEPVAAPGFTSGVR